jgi:antitoxin ParD1/3/4
MPDLTISLPEDQRRLVDAAVARGGHASASDYIAALIDADSRRAAEEWLDARLREGLDTPETEMTSEDWRAIRHAARARAAKAGTQAG